MINAAYLLFTIISSLQHQNSTLHIGRGPSMECGYEHDEPVKAEPKETRIALFGGSFDPPHCAHVAMAVAAVDQCGLDRVIFIPCRESPLKGRLPGASGAQRLEMLQLAIRGRPEMEVSDFELQRPGPSYSWQTAEHFRHLYPGSCLYWLMGTDQWSNVHRWARVDYLAGLVSFIVVSRHGQRPEPRAGVRAHFLAGEFAGSSTGVREKLAAGEGAADLLPDAVAEYVRVNGLYRQTC